MTTRESARANELCLRRRRGKRIGALEHFPRLGRSKRLALPHTSALAARARMEPLLLLCVIRSLLALRRGRVGGGGGGGVALGRLLRGFGGPLPLRRRRFLWRRRSQRRAPASPASAAAAAVRGAAGRALDVRAVGAGDVDGLRARVVALLHLELDRFLLRGEKRRSGWMGNAGICVSSGKRSLASEAFVCSRAGRRRGARDEKRARGDVSSIDGGGARGGEGWDARWGRTAPRRARARGARGRLARRGDGGARARATRDAAGRNAW